MAAWASNGRSNKWVSRVRWCSACDRRLRKIFGYLGTTLEFHLIAQSTDGVQAELLLLDRLCVFSHGLVLTALFGFSAEIGRPLLATLRHALRRSQLVLCGAFC